MNHVKRALVIGGGVAGLNAAYQLAKRGVAPVVVEARGRAGGLVCGADVGGVRVDLGAESYARRSRYCTDLISELGLPLVTPGGSSWIWAHDDGGHAYPIPTGIMGIPADLDAPDVVAALGPDAVARARQDRDLGPDVGADIDNLAGFVAARMGSDVVRRYVAPVAGGVHSTDPSRLAVDAIAPGLRERLREFGSLERAVQAQRAAAPQGSVVAAIEGGMFRLPEALAAAVQERGGEIRPRTLCADLSREGEAWRATLAEAVPGATPADDPVAGPQRSAETFDAVVIATGGRPALGLLARLPGLADVAWELPRGADLAGVTLTLEAPELDAAPRGSGLLVAPVGPGETATVQAKALTHYSIKWGWVREHTPLHVLRLSYGRDGQPRPEPTPADALRDASRLLGVELGDDRLRGAMVVHWNDSLPPHTPEHRAHLAGLRGAVEALPGLGIVGAWYAGTGLAAVLPQAEDTAERLAGR